MFSFEEQKYFDNNDKIRSHTNKGFEYLLITSIIQSNLCDDDLSERIKSNGRNHIGGIDEAGLFSDSHFVFYPAGNRLWSLDSERSKIGYNYLTSMFRCILIIRSFPSDLQLIEKSNINVEKR
jgi:hypothetical protein